MQDKINVMIVDDHQVVRQGLRLFLEADRKLAVCGEAGSLTEMLEKLPDARPDIILMDFKLPDGDGVTGCSAVCSKYPDARVIILTAYAGESVMTDAQDAGAAAYLLKDIESDELVSMIKSVAAQPSDCDGAMNRSSSALKREFDLSSRDMQMLDMIALGKVNKEISATLQISDKTVRNNLLKVYKKINVTNRTEAAAFWIRQQRLKDTSQ